MARIPIAPYSKFTDHEKPYYWVQVIPDRINYSIAANMPTKYIKDAIAGTTGTKENSSFNVKLQYFLDVLSQRNAINPALIAAWYTYSELATQSQDPNTDQPLQDSLLEFRKLTCVGSSYNKLPKAAHKVAYWQLPGEVPLPRISQAEHVALGSQPAI
jgi:hypothetical protein